MKRYKITPRVKELATNTRKREFSVSSGYTKICTDTYSDGGSISYWTVINTKTGAYHIPNRGTYPWTVPNDYTLQPGDVVMETGMFCGKPMAPRFCCRTEDEAAVLKWLGVPVEQPIVPLGFASLNQETGETTIRTKI